MNDPESRGHWQAAKEKLKQRWSELTDGDLEYPEGLRNELIGRIHERTGESHEAIEETLRVLAPGDLP